MEKAKVTECEVTDCAYNMDKTCHAMAITIGDTVKPRCDTFCMSSKKGGEEGYVASVGACKVSVCAYNIALECNSPAICVGYQEGEPDCLTFKAI